MYRIIVGRWEVNGVDYLTAKEARKHGTPRRQRGLLSPVKHPTNPKALKLWLDRHWSPLKWKEHKKWK